MKQSFFAVIGRVVFAAATLAIATAAPLSASTSNLEADEPLLTAQAPRRQPGQNPRRDNVQPPRRQPRQNQRRNTVQPPRRQPSNSPAENNAPVPDAIADAVVKDLSQQTGMRASALRIVEAAQETWSDGCLGLGSPGIACSQALVPGWRVVVASGQQRWVYRTNLYGSVVKLDPVATRTLTARLVQPTPTRQQVTPPTAQTPPQTLPRTERPPIVVPRNRIQVPPRTPLTEGRGNFSLTIRQPSTAQNNVIARLSLKPQQATRYGSEQFIGDFRYQLNQRAQFTGGINPGDRIVARLYDAQNRLIGFSEFELLPTNTAVNLILGQRPALNRTVRTIYGTDANQDGNIDPTAALYDYFTQIVGFAPEEERVTFVNTLPETNLTWFQVAGLPVPPRQSIYPNSFSRGNGAIVGSPVAIFSSDLSPALTSAPGQTGPVNTLNPSNTSTFNVSQLLGTAPAPVVTRSTQPPATVVRPLPPPATVVRPTPPPTAAIQTPAVSFPDVPSNYWARNFIAQLAAKEILQGYPDGLYRPEATVTRAEFASILSQAFDREKTRNMVAFRDMPTNHWAYPAIKKAYEMGFFDTNNRRVFNPDQKVSRLDVLVALAKGLNYSPNGSPATVLRVYRDAAGIPREDRSFIAAVTERNIVVNYPNVRTLNPRREATRAEVAALIYRALVSTGQAADLSSPYVAGEGTDANEVELRQRPRPAEQRRRTPVRRRSSTNG